MNELNIDTAQLLEDQSTHDCWAYRSRRVYCSWEGGHLLRCNHTDNNNGVEYCIPLFSLDKLIAIFSLRFRYTSAPANFFSSTEFSNIRTAKLSEFITISQSISGALSTIALRESLQRMALTDELTGLPNRRAFQNDCIRMISQSRRLQRPFVIAILDIDHFKRINDDFGHAEGDKVLQKFSTLIKQNIRTGDIAGRIGGEEFGILLQDCNKENGTTRLQELLQTVRNNCTAGNRMVTFSAGCICSQDTKPDTTLDSMVKISDDALYKAKENGRNQVAYGNPS
jgi:diguanylate cyclase (GGDEF)-like protein